MEKIGLEPLEPLVNNLLLPCLSFLFSIIFLCTMPKDVRILKDDPLCLQNAELHNGAFFWYFCSKYCWFYSHIACQLDGRVDLWTRVYALFQGLTDKMMIQLFLADNLCHQFAQVTLSGKILSPHAIQSAAIDKITIGVFRICQQ